MEASWQDCQVRNSTQPVMRNQMDKSTCETMGSTAQRTRMLERHDSTREPLQVCTKLTYLGMLISPQDIRPDPARSQLARDMSSPETLQDLRRTLGIFSYYRKSIPHFADIVLPLYEMVWESKNTAIDNQGKLVYTKEARESLQALKTSITTEPRKPREALRTTAITLFENSTATSEEQPRGNDHQKSTVLTTLPKETFPDVNDALHEAEWFSAADCCSAYHQFPLNTALSNNFLSKGPEGKIPDGDLRRFRMLSADLHQQDFRPKETFHGKGVSE
jgi:hypothetical protein